MASWHFFCIFQPMSTQRFEQMIEIYSPLESVWEKFMEQPLPSVNGKVLAFIPYQLIRTEVWLDKGRTPSRVTWRFMADPPITKVVVEHTLDSPVNAEKYACLFEARFRELFELKSLVDRIEAQ